MVVIVLMIPVLTSECFLWIQNNKPNERNVLLTVRLPKHLERCKELCYSVLQEVTFVIRYEKAVELLDIDPASRIISSYAND